MENYKIKYECNNLKDRKLNLIEQGDLSNSLSSLEKAIFI